MCGWSIIVLQQCVTRYCASVSHRIEGYDTPIDTRAPTVLSDYTSILSIDAVTRYCASLRAQLKCDQVLLLVAAADAAAAVRWWWLSRFYFTCVDDDDYDVHILCCCTVLKFNKCKNNRLPYASSSNDCALAYCSLGSPVVLVVVVALSVVAAFAFPSSLNCRSAMLVLVCVCVKL